MAHRNGLEAGGEIGIISFVNAKIVVICAAVAATLWTFSIPDAQLFREPALARILCFHLPGALLDPFVVLYMGWAGWMYLRTRTSVWAGRLAASMEIAAILAFLVEATGIVFSKAQWGAWWSNDPRQTSFLIVCMLMAAGLALRAGQTDPEKRNATSAAYAIAIQVPFLFLTFVYTRLPMVKQASLHPSDTIIERGIDYWYWSGVIGVGLAMGMACLTLFRVRVRLELSEAEGE